MRALLIGAVESTAVAFRALSASPDWTIAGVLTLPTDLAGRHSDFVDLEPMAATAGVPIVRAADGNAPEAVAAVAALRADIAFVIGWSQICRPALVSAAGGRMVGYHPAPLPRLRGRAAIPWTILLREPISAASLFWVDDGIDSGPILGQQFFHVAADETATGLYALHMQALGRLLDCLLPALASGTAEAVPQDERHATWAARRTDLDGRIDWSLPADSVERLVRAVTRPYPGAFTGDDAERIRIFGARAVPGGARHAARPGQVVLLHDGGFQVMCGDGQLLDCTDFTGAAPRQHLVLGGRA